MATKPPSSPPPRKNFVHGIYTYLAQKKTSFGDLPRITELFKGQEKKGIENICEDF